MKKSKKQQGDSDMDGGQKEIIDVYVEFFPEIHREIDFRAGVKKLDNDAAHDTVHQV